MKITDPFSRLLLALFLNCIAFAVPALAQKNPVGLTPTTPDGRIILAQPDRWKLKLALAKKGDVDLLFVGDSITQNWDNPENQGTWSAYYGGRKALNIGFSAGRTESMLWMFKQGILDHLNPKVAVLLIGTNNTDGEHFQRQDTPQQVFDGVQAVVQTMRAKMPNTKIILLSIFPRNNVPGTFAEVQQVNALLPKLADSKHVFLENFGNMYMSPTGTINPALMPDLLHPNPLGMLKWAQAMEPLLEKLMGKPQNTAATPQPGIEPDVYNWPQRHAQEIAYVKAHQNAKLVFIGDSITHFFGGEPTASIARGADVWQHFYGGRSAINLGFGWDRTQQVLWRLQNGEFAGLHPKTAVVMIGTNNLTPDRARGNTDAEIVAGIHAICKLIQHDSPTTKILLEGIFPRGDDPNDVLRYRINAINDQLARDAFSWNVTFINPGPLLLAPDGHFLPDVTVDFLHPNNAGYAIIANAIEPVLAPMLGEPEIAPLESVATTPEG